MASVAARKKQASSSRLLTELTQGISLSLDWLAENGPSYGIAGPVVLSGWPAGAHIAALALGHPAVTARLAVSGVHDLAPIRDTFLNNGLKMSDEGDYQAFTAAPSDYSKAS
jgi:acetyl esterase/lipase